VAGTLARAMLCLAAAMMLHAAGVQAENLQYNYNITYSELKFGVLAHDVHFAGGVENGIDINPEVIFQSPVNDGWAMTVPDYIRWIVQPRPTIGFIVNTAHYTDQFYFGGTWTWQLARSVFLPEDGITFGIFFGPGFNDGKTHSTFTDRKNLGSALLFREAGEIGYRFDQVWTISAYFDHISNGGLSRYNQSINNMGARIGMRF
jgi:hypothetical protein